jgi:hypothetical protein
MSTWATGIDVYDENQKHVLEIDIDDDIQYSFMRLSYVIYGRMVSSMRVPGIITPPRSLEVPQWLRNEIDRMKETGHYSDECSVIDKSFFDGFDTKALFQWQLFNYHFNQFETVEESYSHFWSCQEVDDAIEKIKQSPGKYVVFWFNP